MTNKITQEELTAVLTARAKLTTTKLEAEKFVAIARVADLETTNLVLNIYNKYGLKVGTDNIREDGTIVRTDPVKEEVVENG
jgi:hypothetical protein